MSTCFAVCNTTDAPNFLKWTDSVTSAEVKAYGETIKSFQGKNNTWRSKVAKNVRSYVISNSRDGQVWMTVGVISYNGVCNLDAQGVPTDARDPKCKAAKVVKNLCTVLVFIFILYNYIIQTIIHTIHTIHPPLLY